MTKIIKIEEHESFLMLEVTHKGNVYKGIVLMAEEDKDEENKNE